MGIIKIESATGAKIYINKKDHGTIKKGTQEYEVENGPCEIYAKAGWCTSQKRTVNLSEAQSVTFTLNTFKYEGVAKAIFMLLALLLVLTKIMILGIIAGLVFLYPLYYLTIGKDKYFELVEKETSDKENVQSV
ncbi:hypothetical protein Q4603_15475 [Zobellia galactanivorans]|uniref:hypothetical protein n=1 Tax=Zobellia galactanivorans (strain DSM 12802 / CCUG 47099 / CIP 106680 / NCIMB 13871 / Dsij) TaxID=63186 RepID=UPI0026E2069C|nr:hypothetical protein [Zobellia galactanivorans]MDO6810024.1 hypothetical protein [Zobellia galactanivorans]